MFFLKEIHGSWNLTLFFKNVLTTFSFKSLSKNIQYIQSFTLSSFLFSQLWQKVRTAVCLLWFCSCGRTDGFQCDWLIKAAFLNWWVEAQKWVADLFWLDFGISKYMCVYRGNVEQVFCWIHIQQLTYQTWFKVDWCFFFFYTNFALRLGEKEEHMRLYQLRIAAFKCLKVQRLWAAEAGCGVTERRHAVQPRWQFITVCFTAIVRAARCSLNVTYSVDCFQTVK